MATNISGINPTGTPSSLDVFNASNEAISFKEQLPDLESKLREALTSKFQNNPLFAQREQAQQGFLNAPSQARADISQMQQTSGVPLSPTQQEAITSGRRSAAFAPLSTANLLLGNAFGGLEGIVGSGVKAFEAAANAKSERANLMNTMRQQEIERQFKEQEMNLSWAKLTASQGKAAKNDLKKQQDALQSLNGSLTAIQNARNSLQQGGAGFSGILANLRKRLPTGWPGGLSKETSMLDSALATVNKSLFETAGKAFTATEAEILGGRVPKTSYQSEHIQTILDELERDILSRQLQILGGQYNLEGTSNTPSLDEFWTE